MSKYFLLSMISILTNVSPVLSEDPETSNLKVPFTVSWETTRAVSPVRPEGTVDYTAALNEALKGDITPEENAAVAIVKAIGPNPDNAGYEYHVRLCEALGVEPLPEDAPGYVEFGTEGYGFIEPAEGSESENIYDIINDGVLERPWKKEELPNAWRWVELNESVLDQISKAVLLPRYYRPVLLDEEYDNLLIYTPQSELLASRSVSRCLLARAMLRLGEEDYQSAADDLLTLHRFARKIAKGPTMLDVYGGYSFDYRSQEGDIQLLQLNDLPLSILHNYRVQLSELEQSPSVAEKVDLAERYMVLQFMQRVATNQLDMETVKKISSSWPDSKPLEYLVYHTDTDWNPIFEKVNSTFDEAVEVLNKPNLVDRKVAWDHFYNALNTEKYNPNLERLMTSRRAETVSREFIDEALVKTFVNLLLPFFNNWDQTERRAQARSEMSLLALKLKEIQLKEGRYPSTLPESTMDPFSGESYMYRVEDGEFILYSVGKNRRDDGGFGRENDEDPETDDLTVTSRAEK
ncbi:hypothetical protein [Rubinisphaera sp.]|uniref:hypothetical protein n=1 Tax=Rubinisphaera sp. TaxID=2024857 RepID=UPI000C112311|nr:hypothetical protein [Rubinisphaera sp.]MBV07776.1 hypothetical protein [Rubinisphaera sp.]HCS53809.1 hypothetical protein [Planctomycetaceae bacterium]